MALFICYCFFSRGWFFVAVLTTPTPGDVDLVASVAADVMVMWCRREKAATFIGTSFSWKKHPSHNLLLCCSALLAVAVAADIAHTRGLHIPRFR